MLLDHARRIPEIGAILLYLAKEGHAVALFLTSGLEAAKAAHADSVVMPEYLSTHARAALEVLNGGGTSRQAMAAIAEHFLSKRN